ncbi:3-deoxy-D-manno-octulosonic acid transferase [Devosia sp.]|uniref:3-deoxy-D-manno-octulosonic acid transferase n=1 Tax=Devosia sp. TaxID=1871048 RepID=UPI0035B29686
MKRTTTVGWRAYGALVRTLSALHYGVLSPLSASDEGGLAWLGRRLQSAPPPAASGPRIWIHAVSAGESKVAELLRRHLLTLAPELSVVLSATTYSGFARVARVAGEAASFVMPLDTLGAQRRLFATLRPDLLVLVESEFWPAQFAAAAEAGVPVVVVNATLSARSFARHRRFPLVARRTLLEARRIYAQDDTTGSRYRALGVPAERLRISGNLKLAPTGAVLPPRVAGTPAVVFGNIHAAELRPLGPAVRALRRLHPGVRVTLVPRYPGKLDAATLAAAFGSDLSVVTDAAAAASVPLAWVDRMGVLASLYAEASIGVVCGTFAPIGGHDLAEPLQMGTVSLYGPHVERQAALHAALGAAGCARQVPDADALPAAIGALLDRPEEGETMLRRFRALSEAAAAGLAGIAADLVALLPPQ